MGISQRFHLRLTVFSWESPKIEMNLSKKLKEDEVSESMSKEGSVYIKKIGVIVACLILLNLPLLLVSTQVKSRESYQDQAAKTVAQGWGESVHFGGVVVRHGTDEFYPTGAKTHIIMETSLKKKGNFEVPVYTAKVSTNVKFVNHRIKKSKEVLLSRLEINSDSMRSLQSFQVVDVKTGKKIPLSLNPDNTKQLIAKLGVKQTSVHWQIDLVFQGTRPLVFESFADKETLVMEGDWSKPKFLESTLPSKTRLKDSHFFAQWDITALPFAAGADRTSKVIGVELLPHSTDYSKIDRAVKYGILYIAMTFLLMFLLEFLTDYKVHTVQYCMIGLSITVFYLLLLALSEEVGFDWAYLSASVATIFLVIFYLYGFIRNKKYIFICLSEQVFISGFFFLLLRLQERSFLLGSVVLFLTLAVFMLTTRQFDWSKGRFLGERS